MKQKISSGLFVLALCTACTSVFPLPNPSSSGPDPGASQLPSPLESQSPLSLPRPSPSAAHLTEPTPSVDPFLPHYATCPGVLMEAQFNNEPVLIPNSDWLLYKRGRNSFRMFGGPQCGDTASSNNSPDAYLLLNLQNGESHELPVGRNENYPIWSDDGRFIVTVNQPGPRSLHLIRLQSGYREEVVLPPIEAGLYPIGFSEGDQAFDYAVMQKAGEYDYFRIQVTPEVLGPKWLFRTTSEEINRSVFWLPGQGETLEFMNEEAPRSSGPTVRQLTIQQKNGDTLRSRLVSRLPLTETMQMGRFAISPDESRVAVWLQEHISPNDQKYSLQVVNLRTGQTEAGFAEAMDVGPMRWSPGSNKLVFAAKREGKMDLYQFTPGQAAQKLNLSHPQLEGLTLGSAAWSSDETKLVFSAGRRIDQGAYSVDQEDIFLLNLLSGRLTQVTCARHALGDFNSGIFQDLDQNWTCL